MPKNGLDNSKKGKNGRPHQLLADERAKQVYIFYLEGYTTRQIATKMGITQQAVSAHLLREKTKFDEETKDLFRDMVAKALQTKLGECTELIAQYPDNAKVKLLAMEQYRKFCADIRKLTGIDEPVVNKVDVTSKGEPITTFTGEEWAAIAKEQNEAND